MEQLYLLGHQQGTELRGESLDEILGCEHSGPMDATVGVIIEFPEMYKLIDCARIGLEVPDKLLVLPARDPAPMPHKYLVLNLKKTV